jgi:hypothetical protein
VKSDPVPMHLKLALNVEKSVPLRINLRCPTLALHGKFSYIPLHLKWYTKTPKINETINFYFEVEPQEFYFKGIFHFGNFNLCSHRIPVDLTKKPT